MIEQVQTHGRQTAWLQHEDLGSFASGERVDCNQSD